VIYDEPNKKVLVINCKTGLIPVFYVQHNGYFIFSSKLGSILKSRLVKPDINYDTIIESLLFNYPISNNTHVKNISQLESSSIIGIFENTFRKFKYWDFTELFKLESISKKESVDLIDNTLKNVISKISKTDNHIATTLTGGWDGRLVLSYLNNIPKDKILLYSFGSKNSPDIVIPEIISKKLGYQYQPFILDDTYLEENFINSAKKTIINSDGFVTFTRAHYYHTLMNVGKMTDRVLSGNGGSNILKNVNKPGMVFNHNLLPLFSNGFSKDSIRNVYRNNHIENFVFTDNNQLDRLINNIQESEVLRDNSFTKNQVFYHFLLSNIERKYFGMEIASYSSRLHNLSPFFDDDFLHALAQTQYIGYKNDFLKGDLLSKEKISKLYANLIKRNTPELMSFSSDKGFSLSELTNPIFYPKIVFRKYIKNKLFRPKPADNYNTHVTYSQFFHTLPNHGLKDDEFINFQNLQSAFESNSYSHNKSFFASLLSIFYWIQSELN
jgi:asparagine synthetase B (glutamine-hydrolysing)